MTSRPSLLLPAPAAGKQPGALRRAYQWFTRRWIGRIVLAALFLWSLEFFGVEVPQPLGGLAWFITWAFFLFTAWKAFRFVLRRLLWRIRTKLLVSYLFVAVVPLVLLTLFFALVGLISGGLVAAYMLGTEAERKAEELGREAESTLAALSASAGAPTPAAVEKALAPVRAAHPSLLYVYVRNGVPVAVTPPLAAELPAWLGGGSFAGLVRLPTESTVRAVARRDRSWLMLDVPIDRGLFADLERNASIRLLAAGGSVRASAGGGVNIEFKDDEDPAVKDGSGGLRQPPPPPEGVRGLPFVSTPDQTLWSTGAKEGVALAFLYDPRVVVRRLSPGTINTTDWMLPALASVGGIFLVMYAVALMVGLLLARSITRSVHNLSRGTERIRQGHFDRPIPVRSRDQLGELAESFNLMARDIQQLLRESAEKERLEEELRIARKIQMSLLPQDTVTVPHLDLAATCIPATEVGGDYYDLLPLPGDRLAVLVADVSGKGTSAALYMAELKGLMLSLSRVHESPAALLAEANRILAGDIDSRSFITMCYAVVEPRARRMRYARAGHSPLIQLQSATGTTRLLAPPGLGLGLDRGTRFEELLKEEELPLVPGDVFLFFTDGISEAMNTRGELYGEERLRAALSREPGATAEQVRDRVLTEVQAFQGPAPQHDDMTMVVLRVEAP
jgi:phosphoserine phosphatase RsbU/P